MRLNKGLAKRRSVTKLENQKLTIFWNMAANVLSCESIREKEKETRGNHVEFKSFVQGLLPFGQGP